MWTSFTDASRADVKSRAGSTPNDNVKFGAGGGWFRLWELKLKKYVLTSCPSFVPSFFPPKKRKPVIEAVARATGRGADSSVSPGARRQRPVMAIHSPKLWK